MKVALSFAGGGDLSRALNALPDEVKGDVLLDALREAGEPIRADMASTVRKSAPARVIGGQTAPHLSDHIGLSPLKAVEGVKLHEDEAAVGIGPTKDFFYGLYLEYGTRHSPAFPFARPAMDRGHQAALAAIGQRLWAAIRQGAQ